MSDVVLVVLHDIPKSQLIGDFSDRVSHVAMDDARVIGKRIAHFAFAGEPGQLYRCSQNEQAFDTLVELLEESRHTDMDTLL